MRTLGKMALALTGAFLFVTLVGGQGGGFKGFGGFGGFNADPVALLRNESVKKEIGLSEEQAAKIPDAVNKALAAVLDAKQLKRLHEIELQQRGPAALADKTVQTELKLTKDQAKNIKTILDDSRKHMEELMSEAKGGGFQGMREKMQSLRKETNDKLQEVLNSEQRRMWKSMLGDEFKMSFGGGGKGRKKGDDME